METHNPTQPNQPTTPPVVEKLRPNTNAPAQLVISIDELVTRANAHNSKANLREGLKVVAKYISAKIDEKKANRSKAAIVIDKATISSLLDNYQCKAHLATKEKVLRKALIDAQIIKRRKSLVRYRGARKEEFIRSQSSFNLCYFEAAQKAKIHLFIKTFAELELANPQ